MKPVRKLMQNLLDTRSAKTRIQCSDVKTAKSVFKVFEEALEYNFVRFGNKYFIPAISIDIDNHKDIDKVLKVISDNELPTPNFIVKTAKGLHIHWVLENAVSTYSLPSLRLYQRIASNMVKVFDSDANAMPKFSGRMFRNPLKHDTVYYNDTLHSLEEFKVIIPKVEFDRKTGTITRVKKKGYKTPDFTKITEGARNTTLFDYGRHVAYSFGKRRGLKKRIESALVAANGLLPEPVTYTELHSIIDSIYSFMQTKYTANSNNSKTVAFNRRLAQRQQRLKQVELLGKWVSLGVLTVKHLKSMSFREGGRVFGISHNTFKKHRDTLIEVFKDLPLSTLKLLKSFKVDSIPNFSLYNLLYIDKGINSTVKCTGPPIAA